VTPFLPIRSIVAPLGAGGMGEAYKARETRLNRTVAIKVLSMPMHRGLWLRRVGSVLLVFFAL